MNAFVLGVDHELQRLDAWRNDAMKHEYRNLLNQLVEQRGVQFIGEEASPAVECVGRQIAVIRNLPREWRNIEMPPEMRQELGIDHEQNNRLVEDRLGGIQSYLGDDGYYENRRNGWHRFYARVPSDDIREDYMTQRALEGAGNAESVLLLCGSMHVGELRKRFVGAGHNVAVDFLHNYGWYSPV